MIDLYNDLHAKDALVFRGGPALNQVLPLKAVTFSMNSPWLKDATDIIIYEMDELIATKLRALYQLPSKLHLDFDEVYTLVIEKVISKMR